MLAFTQDSNAVSKNVYFPGVQEGEVLGFFLVLQLSYSQYREAINFSLHRLI